jgi:hypothetical protein
MTIWIKTLFVWSFLSPPQLYHVASCHLRTTISNKLVDFYSVVGGHHIAWKLSSTKGGYCRKLNDLIGIENPCWGGTKREAPIVVKAHGKGLYPTTHICNMLNMVTWNPPLTCFVWVGHKPTNNIISIKATKVPSMLICMTYNSKICLT